MLLENTDLDGADDAQLDLFYLVDRVLEEIELATQAADDKKDKENIDDCNMPAAAPELDTYDLMDEIDTTGHYTEPQFCPNSTSFDHKSVQQFYQHPQLFNTSFDDTTGNQHVVPEIDMDQFYDSIVNNQFHGSPEEKGIPHTDCQFTAQDFFNHNVQNVNTAQVNIEYVGKAEEGVDLSFAEIPALTACYSEVPKYMSGSNAQGIPHHDDSSNDAHQSDFKGWTRKHPESWTTVDVLDWLFHCAEKIAPEIGEDCSSLRAEKFNNVTGETLCKMGPEDFRLREPKFGLSFYELLRKLLHEGVSFTNPPELTRDQSESDTSYTETEVPSQHFSSLQVTEFDTVHSYVNSVNSGQSSSCTSPEMYPTYFPFDYSNPSIAVTSPNSVEQQMPHLYPNNMNSYDNYSTYDYHYYHRHLPSDITSVRAKYENGITPIRRRPGRPRTKTIQTEEELQAQRAKKLKSQHLWEFIYELLNNPSYNPSVLKWENQANGVFRFIQSETVAQLWGNLKSNENMTYEKLSRAMRHYYKRGIMERVEGRRLVYKYSRATLDKMRQKHGFQT